jgi:hypothetical protein
VDLSFFTTPTGIAVIAAVGSFIAGLAGAGISSWTIRSTHSERLAADEKLAERKFEFDTQLAEKKFRLDAAFADRKRRQNLAEQALTDFYSARDVITWARFPGAFGNEGQPGCEEKMKLTMKPAIKTRCMFPSND